MRMYNLYFFLQEVLLTKEKPCCQFTVHEEGLSLSLSIESDEKSITNSQLLTRLNGTVDTGT